MEKAQSGKFRTDLGWGWSSGIVTTCFALFKQDLAPLFVLWARQDDPVPVLPTQTE